MIGAMIAFVLRNLPGLLLILALLLAAADGRRSAERALDWILLLPLGIAGLWAALFHLAFPSVAAADIGWQESPFQFEVGIADLAFGVICCLAFRAPMAFKAAAVCVSAIALLGDAVGHVIQMVVARNFAPGNAGVVFWTDILVPVLALILLGVAWRQSRRFR